MTSHACIVVKYYEHTLKQRERNIWTLVIGTDSTAKQQTLTDRNIYREATTP